MTELQALANEYGFMKKRPLLQSAFCKRHSRQRCLLKIFGDECVFVSYNVHVQNRVARIILKILSS